MHNVYYIFPFVSLTLCVAFTLDTNMLHASRGNLRQTCNRLIDQEFTAEIMFSIL